MLWIFKNIVWLFPFVSGQDGEEKTEEGNIFSGAVPPWLRPDPEPDNAQREIGPTMEDFSKHCDYTYCFIICLLIAKAVELTLLTGNALIHCINPWSLILNWQRKAKYSGL